MALLPNAKVAIRLALANYLRTNLSAAWPSLVVSENWPTPQRAMPPQALTVLAPDSGHVIEYHTPVVWATTYVSGVSATTLYSYGKLTIPLQLDAWAQYESIRDDLSASIVPLLNQNPEVTLGTAGSAFELPLSPGLVIPVPTYYSVTTDMIFDAAPSPAETEGPAMVGEWRQTWEGKAVIYLMDQKTVPMMRTIIAQPAYNGAAADIVPLAQTPSSMAVTPATPTIAHAATQQMVATSTLADASTCDVSAWSTWTSSNPTVATVSATGLVTNVAPGTATITATFLGVSASTVVTLS